MRFPFRRQGNALIPFNEAAQAALIRVADCAIVMIKIIRARNLRQHNLFWALAQVVAEQFDLTKEAMKEELCIRAGHFVRVEFSTGEIQIRGASIAFENMGQDRFDSMFRVATEKAAQMLGNSPQEVIDRVNDMLDPMDRYTWAMAA